MPGNLNHAVRLFQSLIARDPRFALAHAGLAEAFWAQRRETGDESWTLKAVAANLDALKIDPDQPEVRMSLAVTYAAQGRHDDAITEVKQVLDRQPDNDGAHRILSDVHAARTEWTEAESGARRAIASRPAYWRNHHQLGLVFFDAGRYEEAAAAFERVVQLQPDSARGYQTLGTALQAAGRNDDALQQYEKAITIRPSGRTYSNIGTLYFWRGEYPSAIKAYENAVALLPNDPALRANLGDAYAKVGEFARATQSYRQAVADVERFLRISPADAQDRLEPPCTDPYARWCGRGRRVTAAPMPINASYRQMKKPPVYCERLFLLGRLQESGKEFSEVLGVGVSGAALELFRSTSYFEYSL